MEHVPYSLNRAKRCLSKAQALHADAERSDRDLNNEERGRYDDLMGQATRAAAESESELAVFGQLQKMLGTGTEDLSSPTRRTSPTSVIEQREQRTSSAPTVPILVPSIAEYRAQAEGLDATGGYTVPVEQSRIVVDRMRPASVFLKAGPRIFTMASDQLSVPKIGTSSVVSMVLENAEIPASDITFASALFTARKLAGIVRSSNEWLVDSVPDARLIVERDLVAQMGVVLDQQLFAGSGVAPNILGLLNTAGATTTAITGALTLDAVSLAVQRIQVDNGSPNAIFVSPAVWGGLSRLKDADTRYHIAPDPTMDARMQLFGVPVYVTAAVGNVAIVVDLSQVGVGVRSRWTVHYDPFRYSEFDQTAIRVTSRWDMQVLNNTAVELLTGLT